MMSIQGVFMQQIKLMTGFLIFAWVPSLYFGTVLGLLQSCCLFGAIPNASLGLIGSTPTAIKTILSYLTGVIVLAALIDMKFFVSHPYQVGLQITDDNVSNKIFLYQKKSDEQ